MALTIVSWTGLYYTFDTKERTLMFETFLKFLGAFRSLNNYKMRILVGGLYNVDLKVTQFWRFPDLVPLVYTNRPNPNERRELQCSFIYTKDTLKMMDHAVQKIGDRSQDYWAISASIAAIATEKGEASPYSDTNLSTMEEALGARASDLTFRSNCLGVQEDYCLIRDTSSSASDSGAYSGSTESNGNDSHRESNSAQFMNTRRAQKAYIDHLDRYGQKDKALQPVLSPSSPKKSAKNSGDNSMASRGQSPNGGKDSIKDSFTKAEGTHAVSIESEAATRLAVTQRKKIPSWDPSVTVPSGCLKNIKEEPEDNVFEA